MDPLSIYERTATEDVIEQAGNAMNNRLLGARRLAMARRQPSQPQMQFDTQSYSPSAMLRQDAMLNGKYPLTQAFGNWNPEIEKYSGGVNYGADFATPRGTPIALPSGTWRVVEASGNGAFNRGYGNSILAMNQETGEKIRFSHLNRLNVGNGQNLQGGSVVGYSGSTGNSTGPHIDIEYYTKAGKPADILKSSYARELFS